MSLKNCKIYHLNCGEKVLELSKRTHIMGILNITPDSFSDGGKFFSKSQAIGRAIQMQEEGADIIDIGGESTRPGAEPVSFDEEFRRIIPVIEALKGKLKIPISIDTYKSQVAEAALLAGASIVNDISGLRFDPQMAHLVSQYKVPVVMMHIQGTPKNMQVNPQYNNLIGDISRYLQESIQIAMKAGIPRDQIVIDPGIGFGKSVKDNFIIINRLNEFSSLECPILIGVSRKSFIGKSLNNLETDRLLGTASAVAISILHGVHIVRVHNVKEMVQVVSIADNINNSI